eukprot:1150108-Pelagomonas_calceolata.AAC.2
MGPAQPKNVAILISFQVERSELAEMGWLDPVLLSSGGALPTLEAVPLTEPRFVSVSAWDIQWERHY